MSSSAVVSGSTLADIVVRRGIVANVLLVLGGAAFTGLLAQVAVPLWPVPITGQTLAVLLVGTALGATRGALSLAAYAVLGIAGVPWFSDATAGWGVVAGPTGGYIVGFIVAAWLSGLLAQRHWDRRIIGALLSFAAGSVVVFAIGLPWLAVVLGLNLEQTLEAGLYPFILGGVIKALIAVGVVWGTWHIAGRMRSRRAGPER